MRKIGGRAGQLANESNGVLSFETNDGKNIGNILIKKVTQIESHSDVVLLYQGTDGYHSFLNPFHQLVNKWVERFRVHNAGNVGLSENLYDQVRIAYSVARTISVVTISDGSKLNLFPTDLHGPVGSEFYISSLRIGGLANSQVEKYQNVVISEIEARRYREIYLLGKNHMRELKAADEFKLSPKRSASLNYSLPAGVTYYREMKLVRSLDIGIHRIHLYKITHQQSAGIGNSVLAHIHQFYAQWRINQKLFTDFLIR